MNYLFRLIGLTIIVLSFWGFGFYKAISIKSKRDFLLKVCFCLDELSNKIRMGAGERKEIIEESFSKTDAEFNGKTLIIDNKLVENEDKKLIDNLFFEIGKSDRNGECERISHYRNLLYKRYETLDFEYKSKSKIWQTVCLCSGLSVAILMI